MKYPLRSPGTPPRSTVVHREVVVPVTPAKNLPFLALIRHEQTEAAYGLQLTAEQLDAHVRRAMDRARRNEQSRSWGPVDQIAACWRAWWERYGRR